MNLGREASLLSSPVSPFFKVFCVIFGRVIWVEMFGSRSILLSLHYCTTRASPLNSPASSKSLDSTRHVPHRPYTSARGIHAPGTSLPRDGHTPRATLPPSPTTADDDFRRIPVISCRWLPPSPHQASDGSFYFCLVFCFLG